MTKQELITRICTDLEGEGITKKMVGQIVDSVFDSTGKAICKEGRFAYPGFGTFVVRKRKARKGRNPQTGEAIKIKASKSVGFRAARSLKEKL